MKYFFLFFSLLYSDFSYSDPGWITVKEDRSVLRIEDNFGTCTGTRVSRNGHILTARHCLNDCLISSNYVEPVRLYPEFGHRSPNLYLFTNRKPTYCDLSVNGESKTLKVVAASRGFMIPSEQRSLGVFDWNLYVSFLDNSYFHNGDFAILQDETSTGGECKSIGRYKLIPGDYVHYLGFPDATTGRPDGMNSDGNQLRMGRGRIIESISQNPCANITDRLKTRYDRDDLLLSTVDIVHGASGSSLLDRNGNVVGLLNSSFGQGVKISSQYCEGSAVAIKIETILGFLKENEFLNSNETFSCH